MHNSRHDISDKDWELLNTSYLDVPEGMEGSEKTNDCSSMRLVTFPKQASPGETFPIDMEILTASGSDIIAGLNGQKLCHHAALRSSCLSIPPSHSQQTISSELTAEAF